MYKSLVVYLSISLWILQGVSSMRLVPFPSRRALFRSKSCFCFQKPLSHTDINELIDTNGNGLERLVVYFYKDIKTNELKMYTPNIEKQRLIPNLAYEGGDFIDNVTSQDIFDIFNTNPNVVDATSVYDKDFDISISKEPIGYNIGQIEEHTSNNKITKNFDKLEGKPDNVDINANEKAHVNDASSDIGSNNEEGPYANFPSSTKEIVGETSTTAKPTDKYPNNDYTKIFTGNQAPSDQEDNIFYQEPSMINEHSNEDDPEFSHLLETLPDDYLDISNHDKEVSYIDKPLNIDYNLSNSSGGNYSGSPEGSRPHLIYPYKGNYLTIFEKWFKDQVDRFDEGKSADSEINYDYVRLLLEDILLQNGIIVTKEGMITNDGIKLNMTNLSLRPIIIGDSVDYYKLLKSGDKFEIPQQSSFLKAVLVSLVKPLKILGIIPLGKTNSPNKTWQLYTTIEDSMPTDDPSDVFGTNDDVLGSNKYDVFNPHQNYAYNGLKYSMIPEKKPSNKYHHICNLRNCENERKRLQLNAEKKKSGPRTEHEYAPHRTFNKRRQGLKDKRIKSNQNPIPKKLKETSKEGGGNVANTRRFPVAKLLSKILSLLNSDSIVTSKKNNTQEQISPLLEENYEEEEKQAKKDESEDEKDSMYRIIGGTPATGTGAPLNSRGRRFA